MEKQHRNVLVLSGCQATLQTITGATMVSVTGLAGFALADDKAFATVPLTCYVLGSAITTIPASLLMKSDRPPRRASRPAPRAGMIGAARLRGRALRRELLAAVRRHVPDGHATPRSASTTASRPPTPPT